MLSLNLGKAELDFFLVNRATEMQRLLGCFTANPWSCEAEYPSQCRRCWAEQGKVEQAEVGTLREAWGAWSLLGTAGVFTPAGVGAHPASLHVKGGCLRADEPRRFVPVADAERLPRHFSFSPLTHAFFS